MIQETSIQLITLGYENADRADIIIAGATSLLPLKTREIATPLLNATIDYDYSEGILKTPNGILGGGEKSLAETGVEAAVGLYFGAVNINIHQSPVSNAFSDTGKDALQFGSNTISGFGSDALKRILNISPVQNNDNMQNQP